MTTQEEREVVQNSYFALLNEPRNVHGEPYDAVISGQVRGLVFRWRELDLQCHAEEGISTPAYGSYSFPLGEEEILHIALTHGPQWHVCTCGKCGYAFSCHDEQTAVNIEELIAVLIRKLRARSNSSNVDREAIEAAAYERAANV